MIDAGIYDPDRHDNHIVAMYDTDAQAQAAYDQLIATGIPATAIQVVSRGPQSATLIHHTEDDDGMWSAIRSMFLPDTDRTAYSHAVGRGHAMLVVTPTPGLDRHRLIQTLENSGPVDFDARLEEWRQEGYDATAPHPAAAEIGDSGRSGQRESLPGAINTRSYVAERGVESSTSAAEPAMRQFNNTRSSR